MKKNLLISFFVVSTFALLMAFGLRRNPNFNPSQLVGKSAPQITAPLLQGGEFKSSERFSKGTWVVVNFWTSSCFVCREEAPDMEKFYRTTLEKSDVPMQFVSINIQDNEQTISTWQKNYQQTFPVVQDKRGSISLDYGVTGTPETFFIDPKGVVLHRIAGGVSQATILKTIAKLQK